jgi:hypothetical protein
MVTVNEYLREVDEDWLSGDFSSVDDEYTGVLAQVKNMCEQYIVDHNKPPTHMDVNSGEELQSLYMYVAYELGLTFGLIDGTTVLTDG